MSLRFDVSSERIERIFGHPVIQVQTLDTDVCIVGDSFWSHLTLCIHRYRSVGYHLYLTAAFGDGHIRTISGAVSLQCSVEGDAMRYAVVVLYRRSC